MLLGRDGRHRFYAKIHWGEHGTALKRVKSNDAPSVRQGKEPQRKALGRGLEKLGPDVRAAVEVIEKHISDPLVVPEDCQKVGSHANWNDNLQNPLVAASCNLVSYGFSTRGFLISTNLGVREIATASGFNSLSHFAYSFKKCFGRRPSTYRQAWPDQDETPHWPGTLGRFIETLKPSRMAKEASKGLDDGRAG